MRVSDPDSPTNDPGVSVADPIRDVAPHRGRLVRADKVMSDEEAKAFLQTAFCGRTASIDREGYPYIVPNLFVWLDEQVYLHTARRPGHFLDNIRHADCVCFEVDAPGEVFPYGQVECDTSVAYVSVVIFGCIRVVDDVNIQHSFFEAFMRKYAPPDSWGREKLSFPRMQSTIVYAITPETITGKCGQLPSIGDRWPARNLSLSPDWKSRGAPADG